ncbi:MAG: hypothetical protein KIT85_16860 [Pseudolabrys sp.]|nr:hypothetical protein [Pseudolabrys sp.]
MSQLPWNELPPRFLKKRHSSWKALRPEIQAVVVDLANKQGFKCALCDADSNLIIEHDHEPDEGAGDIFTIYNIRGLTCSRCNSALSVHERLERGEYVGLEISESRLSLHSYENYIGRYRSRVSPLIEAELERRMGSSNYWRRRNFMLKFDIWFYEGGNAPSWWIRHRSSEIRSMRKFFRVTEAMLDFINSEIVTNPKPEVLSRIITNLLSLKSVFEKIRTDLLARGIKL